jgi:hypothetical protein
LKRLFTILFIVGLFGFGIAFVAAPWMSFRALRSAAAANDVAGIQEVVDYNAVRSSLRSQLGEDPPNVPPPSLWQDPIGALRGAIGEPIRRPGPDVDSYLTPQALADLSNAAAKAEKKPASAPFRLGDLLPGLAASEVSFWDPTRTRISTLATGDPSKEVIFTFERRSLLRWKLVHLRLPAPIGSTAGSAG